MKGIVLCLKNDVHILVIINGSFQSVPFLIYEKQNAKTLFYFAKALIFFEIRIL